MSKYSEGTLKQTSTKDGRTFFYNFSVELNRWIPHNQYLNLQMRKEIHGENAIKDLIKLKILKRTK